MLVEKSVLRLKVVEAISVQLYNIDSHVEAKVLNNCNATECYWNHCGFAISVITAEHAHCSRFRMNQIQVKL